MSVKAKISKKDKQVQPVSIHKCYFEDSWLDTHVYKGEFLGAGDMFLGPAIILQETSTILIEPDCKAIVNDYGLSLIHI